MHRNPVGFPTFLVGKALHVNILVARVARSARLTKISVDAAMGVERRKVSGRLLGQKPACLKSLRKMYNKQYSIIMKICLLFKLLVYAARYCTLGQRHGGRAVM